MANTEDTIDTERTDLLNHLFAEVTALLEEAHAISSKGQSVGPENSEVLCLTLEKLLNDAQSFVRATSALSSRSTINR